MKILFFATFCMMLFVGCDSSKVSADSRFVALENTTMALLENKEVDSNDDMLLEDAKALIIRADSIGYKLVSSTFLKNNPATTILTSPNGIIIANAKTFLFAKTLSFNDDGSEWNWNKDALGNSIDEFVNILGKDKDALIVFYDSGEDIFSPSGSAHTALIWAKHLGYTNLARLIGGYNAWKDRGY